MKEGLAVSLSNEDGVVVRVAGELDMATAPTLRDVLVALLAAPSASAERVRVDLSRVAFCDSSGIAVFLEAANRARDAGTPLEFHAPSQRLRRLFALVGVDEYLELHDSECVADHGAATGASSA